MAQCNAPLTGLLPLTDLGVGTYLGFMGGLYPNGMNGIPLAHYQRGRAIAEELKAVLDAGQPFAFAGIGFSSSQYVWNQFEPAWAADPNTNKNVKLVNLCKPGINSDALAKLTHTYWVNHVPATLAAAGVAFSDVRVVWVQTGMPQPPSSFPGHAQTMQSNVAQAVRNIKTLFPNCRLAFLTSAHYHGYANQGGVEPFAYEHAFGIKWTIEQQISGDPALDFHGAGEVAPWLGWAGYPWCDGSSPRAHDGLKMICPTDYYPDGVHPNVTGSAKLANVLLSGLLTTWVARPWAMNLPTGGTTGTPPPLTQTAG